MDTDEVFRIENAVLVLFVARSVSQWTRCAVESCYKVVIYRVLQHKAVGIGIENSASYLAGGVDNLGGKVLALKSNHLAEGVLNGWVIALDEVAVDKLNGERGFACSLPPTSRTVSKSPNRRVAKLSCGAYSLRTRTSIQRWASWGRWRAEQKKSSRTNRPTADNSDLPLFGGRHWNGVPDPPGGAREL